MSEIPIIVAAPTCVHESELVRKAPQFGMRVIRRPLDAAELLGIASIEVSTPVLIGVALPRLDPAVVELLLRGNRRVIGIASSVEERQECIRLGIPAVVQAENSLDIWPEIAGHLGVTSTNSNQAQEIESSGSGVWSTGAWAYETPMLQEPAPLNAYVRSGTVVAVWGPQGAPGRTLTALAIARILAAQGNRVCVIDADTVAPAMTLLSGIVEDASGIVVASRYAQRGSLTHQTFMQLARPIDANCWLVGGISHPDRWEELDARALRDVLEVARSVVDFIVVDIGFGLDAPSQSAGLLDIPRYASATSVLQQADAVLAVTQSSPLGIARFLQHLPTAQGLSSGTLTLGVRAAENHSVPSTVKSLRTYGLQHQILGLPSIATADAGHWFASKGGFLRRKKDQWRQLERWCATVNQGEGSTTIKVPTLANL